MASGQERGLRGRIKSVQSTKKITRAMELIAASRIVKAQQRVAAARPYAEQITEVIRNVASAGSGSSHPLLAEREGNGRVGHVVVTADRGLAGAYNTSVIRATERSVDQHRRDGNDYGLVVAGRKGEGYFRYRRYRVDAAFSGFSEKPSYDNARQLAAEVMPRYEGGEYDAVELIYTRFLSAGTQKVTVSRLLPLEMEALTEGGDGPKADYEHEPEPSEILERLLPRYVEARIFAALLDAAASEHAARQRAMKAATDNAEELIKSLSIVANKLRQASITTEIMEIVGGSEALRTTGSSGSDDSSDALVSH